MDKVYIIGKDTLQKPKARYHESMERYEWMKLYYKNGDIVNIDISNFHSSFVSHQKTSSSSKILNNIFNSLDQKNIRGIFNEYPYGVGITPSDFESPTTSLFFLSVSGKDDGMFVICGKCEYIIFGNVEFYKLNKISNTMLEFSTLNVEKITYNNIFCLECKKKKEIE